MKSLTPYEHVSGLGWLVLVALFVIAAFASSCASSGYCKSWNNPCSSVPADTTTSVPS